jgi:hypothetical protein
VRGKKKRIFLKVLLTKHLSDILEQANPGQHNRNSDTDCTGNRDIEWMHLADDQVEL